MNRVVIFDGNYVANAAALGKTGELTNGTLYGMAMMMAGVVQKGDRVIWTFDGLSDAGLDGLWRKQRGTDASKRYKESRRRAKVEEEEIDAGSGESKASWTDGRLAEPDPMKWDEAEEVTGEEIAQKSADAKRTEMYQQMKRFRDWLDELGIEWYGSSSGLYEADDVIYSIFYSLPDDTTNEGAAIKEVVVVSNDSDLYQLWAIRDDLELKFYRPTRGGAAKWFERDDFNAKYLTYPEHWAKIKAICGDGTDDVEGIKGVGIKQAVKYLRGTASERVEEKIEDFKSTGEYDDNLELVELPASWGFHRFNETCTLEGVVDAILTDALWYEPDGVVVLLVGHDAGMLKAELIEKRIETWDRLVVGADMPSLKGRLKL